MKSHSRIALILLSLCPSVALGQGIERVAAGYGVDTTSAGWADLGWHKAVPEIYHAWSAYLMAGRGTEAGASYWSYQERSSWPIYDLTTVAGAYDGGANATVLDIRPARAGSTTEFIVKTLIARVMGQEVKPAILFHVWAIQEEGRWVFGNALPHETKSWLPATVGPINYMITPNGSFTRERSEDLVAFSDSVAARFGVDRLPPLLYYQANDAEELHLAMGIDWAAENAASAYTLTANGLILSGSEVFAEDNRHEIVHVLMSKVAAEGRTHPIINEGLATWLGGAQSMFFDDLMRQYAEYLKANPAVTVDAVLESGSVDKGWYPTGATLVMMAYERGGFEAAKDLFTSGQSNEELRSAMSRLLRMDWAQINTRVRTRVLELAAGN